MSFNEREPPNVNLSFLRQIFNRKTFFFFLFWLKKKLSNCASDKELTSAPTPHEAVSFRRHSVELIFVFCRLNDVFMKNVVVPGFCRFCAIVVTIEVLDPRIMIELMRHDHLNWLKGVIRGRE